jgi:hypothetical protein
VIKTTEDVARRFHEVYEALAPSFGWETQNASAVPWDAVPEENRKLMIAVCQHVLPEIPEVVWGQYTSIQHNRWQTKVGILLNLIEAHGSVQLTTDAINAVNTSPFTGNIDDPYADIASMTTQETLRMAVAAGLVVPGPNAPAWMQPGEKE